MVFRSLNLDFSSVAFVLAHIFGVQQSSLLSYGRCDAESLLSFVSVPGWDSGLNP